MLALISEFSLNSVLLCLQSISYIYTETGQSQGPRLISSDST